MSAEQFQTTINAWIEQGNIEALSLYYVVGRDIRNENAEPRALFIKDGNKGYFSLSYPLLQQLIEADQLEMQLV